MKKFLSVTGILLASLMMVLAFVPFQTNAAEFVTPDKDTGNVTLSSTENHRNLYTVGRGVFLNNNTTGDLYTAGGNITIEGNVEQDLVVAGGNITIDGEVGGDVRIVGGNITINSKVHGDLMVAGGSVVITERSAIDGDLYVAGGQITLDAPVKGQVKINGGDVVVNSQLNNPAAITASKSLTIGDKAVIPSIEYKGVKEQTVKAGAQVGPINYTKIQQRNVTRKAVAGVFTALFFVKVISLFIAGLILIKIFPRTNERLAVAMQRDIWINLGIGALFLVVVPIVAIIVMILVVGLYIGIMAFLAWLLMLCIASITASVVTGAWLINKVNDKPMQYNWLALLIGTIALTLVYLVPFIGAIVVFALLMISFGALIRQFNQHIKNEHNASSSTNLM